MAKSPLEALKEKYMKDPDIIPAKGEDKEPIAEAMAKQQIRQRENNDRAFELLTKAGSNEVDAGSSGGAKEGGDAAMYRLTEFVNKPVEKTDHIDRKMWGEPKKKHLEIMNRPFEILKRDDVEKISLDPPPEFDSEEHKVEINTIKELRGMLDNEAVRERVDKQDEDLLFPFNRYLRDNNLEIDREQFMKIMRDVNTVIFKFKYLFNRPRPHQFTDVDEIDNKGGKSPSYPSGHSTTGAVTAEILSEQFPEHAEEFRVIGTEIGYNRVIAGLHHMSDHLAGLQLASQLIPLFVDVKITKSDEFMGELFKYMAHRQNLLKDMTQIGTQDILDGVRIDKESNPRVPRKKGQPAKSKKHSDLYTDEDPKGTIQGLGFKDDKTARASVKKIRNSNRTHAHKIQAAVAMEQRAKAAGKSSEAGIYRKYINSMKEKTKRLEKHTEEEHVQEHNASDNFYPKVSVDKSKKSLLDQIDQIQSKIVTGDYNIKKSDDIFLLKQDYDVTKLLTEKEFKKIRSSKDDYDKYINDLTEVVSNTATQLGARPTVVDSIKITINQIGSIRDYEEYKKQWERTDRGVGPVFKAAQERNIDIVPPKAQQPAQPETPQAQEPPQTPEPPAPTLDPVQEMEKDRQAMAAAQPIPKEQRPKRSDGVSIDSYHKPYLDPKTEGIRNKGEQGSTTFFDLITQTRAPSKDNFKFRRAGTEEFVDSTVDEYYENTFNQERAVGKSNDETYENPERVYGFGSYQDKDGDINPKTGDFDKNASTNTSATIIGKGDGNHQYEVILPNGDTYQFTMDDEDLGFIDTGKGSKSTRVPDAFFNSIKGYQKLIQAEETPKAEEAPAQETTAEEPVTEEAPAEQPATEETPAQETPAETETTTPDFEVLGVMFEYGAVGRPGDKNFARRMLTAVLKDKDGQIRIASQTPTGKFVPNDGFSAFEHQFDKDDAESIGTMPVHANSRYHGKNAQSFPIDMNQLNEMENDLRKQAVSYKSIREDAKVPEGKGNGAAEANAYNAWIKKTAEDAGGSYDLPDFYQSQIDNPQNYIAYKGASQAFAAGETPPPQQETVETPPEQPVQPVQEQAPAEQPTVEQPAETTVQEPVTTPETPVEQPVDDRQSLINQASESGLLAYVHEQKHGKDNPYTTVETTAAELLDKHKTPDKLRNFLGEQHPKFTKFTEQQKAEAQKLVDETTAQQQAAEAQAQAPNPQEIAQNIADEVNNMPTLFQRDSKGNINPTATATNANMADRYRRLRKLINLHGGVDEAETGLKNSVQAELDKINPNIKQKIEADLRGMRDNLPVGIKRKLAEEHSRADYHEDSHKAEITAARQQSAAKEAQHKADMKETHKKRLDGDLFQGEDHDKHQTLRNHTEGEENKFQEALKEKFANPDSPDFKEGGHDKRDEAKERRERGLPPMDTPPPTNKEGKPYLWHAGSHHWVTPEYMKLHPDIGTGAVKGDVITGLDQVKDANGDQAFIAGDRAAQNKGLAAIKANKDQGLGGSDLVFTNQKASRNEHGHIDYSNVDYHADDKGAEHAGRKNHYVEQHLAEGKDRVKTDSKTGRVLTSDAGNTALQRYGARLKDAGGFTGALQRFRAAVLPGFAGGGLTSDQAAQYSSTSFTDED